MCTPVFEGSEHRSCNLVYMCIHCTVFEFVHTLYSSEHRSYKLYQICACNHNVVHVRIMYPINFQIDYYNFVNGERQSFYYNAIILYMYSYSVSMTCTCIVFMHMHVMTFDPVYKLVHTLIHTLI